MAKTKQSSSLIPAWKVPGYLRPSRPFSVTRTVHYLLLILGCYGIITVLAQDLGIKTGTKQRDIHQEIPMQIALFYSSAYVLTRGYYIPGISTALYFAMKYLVSKGQTSPVCFEGV